MYPKQQLTNAERTHQEIDDMMAIVEMLNEEFDFGYVRSEERIAAKKEKVNRYGAYSEELGMVEKGSYS